ncbi:ABC transporter permease subunit [Rhizobium mongolense]|uniref:His/Glu/Gln/Arg/opine family amino acid ABC transporter permease subunit n=2 Tax=Rhizobium mongolense TaxID=57676 RepID=A0ABR6IYR5_9HYPH|nr:ABC transporter permease subunit [Rhizobium mongolense]MBB4233054.1 His/Glu/Gln/Arg/opine family amino acid ABC transporter permease subunit [Rhizobium mongolense]TVZ74968.1 polar amino acid transport system permease protein [Rhizobium mongolense USDA 1844]
MLNFAILETSAFWWAVLDGLGVTLALTAISMVLGFALGGVLASMHVYGSPAVRFAAKAYIFVFRGVPLLILLFLIYYGLPRVTWFRGSLFWDLVLTSPFRTAVFVLTINNAAYLGEMIRGGLRMVPAGLLEAAAAVGMTKTRAFFRIHAPLALRSILGNLGSETIAVVKASAITSVITVRDLMGGPTVLGKVYLDPLTPLLVVGIMYVVLVQIIDLGTKLVRGHLALPGSVQSHHV